MQNRVEHGPPSPPTIGILLSSGQGRLAELSHLATWSVKERRPLETIVAIRELGDALETLRREKRAKDVALVASPLGGRGVDAAPKGCALLERLSDEWERRRTLLAYLLERPSA